MFFNFLPFDGPGHHAFRHLLLEHNVDNDTWQNHHGKGCKHSRIIKGKLGSKIIKCQGKGPDAGSLCQNQGKHKLIP